MAVHLDACIQCNLCVRACREVQVNDVIGMAGARPSREDRLRFRRPDGQLDLRRLRRVRPGLPDRRADAGDAWSTSNGVYANAPDRDGRQRLPLLRRRLPAHLPDQGRPHRRGRGPGRAGQPEPALRQGPLRLRLCAPSRPADRAADPQGRRRRSTTSTIDPANPCTHFREATWEEALDRAAAGLQRIRDRARRQARWPASARPRARTRRPICSRSWCAPASAPTMSITARGSATPRRSRR